MKLKILGLLMLVPLFHAAASDQQPIQLISSEQELHAEYCRTSNPTNRYCDSPPRGTVALLKVPAKFGEGVSRDIAEAYRRGYFQKLDRTDFFHGHWILRGPATSFGSPEEFFDNIEAKLYHSAEYNQRWHRQERAGVPVERRMPRSFVGWKNGQLQAAKDAVAPNVLLKSHEGAGTVYVEEIVDSNPGLTELKYTSFSGTPKVHLDISIGGIPAGCLADAMFFFLPAANGRYNLPGQGNYEIYMRCTMDAPSITASVQ